jgi:hypothetical protein
MLFLLTENELPAALSAPKEDAKKPLLWKVYSDRLIPLSVIIYLPKQRLT